MSIAYTVGGGRRLAGELREMILGDGAVKAKVTCPDFKGRAEANGAFTGIDGAAVSCHATITPPADAGSKYETDIGISWNGGAASFVLVQKVPLSD